MASPLFLGLLFLLDWHCSIHFKVSKTQAFPGGFSGIHHL